MSFFLSPIGNEQQFDANGNPLVGGKIYTYIAGSSTPTATFVDNSTGTQQANPIILNSLGLSASPIWLTNGVSVKFIIRDSADVLIRTIDNITGVNDITSGVSEWVASSIAPTYVSATSFTLAGDQTQQFQVGRRLLTVNTAGIRYGTIRTSVFGALTTVTVVNDSGTLDSGLSAVSYGLLGATNPSIPSPVKSMVRLNTAPAGAAGYGTTNLAIRRFTNVVTNQGSDITYADSVTLGGSFTVNTPGVYAITYSDNFSTGAIAYGLTLNDANLTTGITVSAATAVLSAGTTPSANFPACISWNGYLAAGSVIRANGNLQPVGTYTNGVQFTIVKVA